MPSYIVKLTLQNTWLFHVTRYQQLIEIIDYLFGNYSFIIYVGINLPDFPGSIIVIALHLKWVQTHYIVLCIKYLEIDLSF